MATNKIIKKLCDNWLSESDNLSPELEHEFHKIKSILCKIADDAGPIQIDALDIKKLFEGGSIPTLFEASVNRTDEKRMSELINKPMDIRTRV